MFRRPSHWFLPLVFLALSSCVSPHLGDRKSSRPPAFERARLAWEALATDGDSPNALASYSEAVTDLALELNSDNAPAFWPTSAKLDSGHIIQIDQGRTTNKVWKLEWLDDIKVEKKVHPSPIANARREGIGAVFNGVREHEDKDRDKKFVFSKGQYLPVTAVLDFNTKPRPTLRLYDPREVSSVTVGQHDLPLAADFATPVQTVLDKKAFSSATLGGLFRPGRFMDDIVLFAQEPYRRDKIPVILVHGLMSDPHIWENIVVALMSDPKIGPHVQCWCYRYPTGLPVANSAMRFRQRLSEAHAAFDADNNDPAMHNMMLVGHSMGGLVSRMQVIDSDLDFWQTWFTKPPEQIPLTGEVSKTLRSALLFKANPDVKRVVFIATPHKGAVLADGWIGRIGASLISIPQQLVQLATSIATLDVEMLNPDRLSMKGLGVNSVSNLSTKHPVIQAMNKKKIKAPVHSIVGVVQNNRPLDKTSDGVVPYWSSHVDTALSEKSVHCGHSCTQNMETVEEVVRLVREHLKQSGIQ